MGQIRAELERSATSGSDSWLRGNVTTKSPDSSVADGRSLVEAATDARGAGVPVQGEGIVEGRERIEVACIVGHAGDGKDERTVFAAHGEAGVEHELAARDAHFALFLKGMPMRMALLQDFCT